MHQAEQDSLQQNSLYAPKLIAESFAEKSSVQDFLRHAVADKDVYKRQG